MNELDIIHLTMKLGALFRRQRHTDELKEVPVNDEETRNSQQAFHGHGRILAVLARAGEIPQNELAEKLGIRPQSLTVAMTRMEERGDIIRKRSPQDRRQILVSITEQGKENSRILEASRLETAVSIFSGLNDEEKETLYNLLDKVLKTQE